MLIKRVIFCCLAMAMSSHASPPIEAKFLSMHEAIVLALAKNTTIQSAEMDRVLDKFALKKADNEFDLQYNLSLERTLFSKNAANTSNVNDESKKGTTVRPGITLKNSIGTTFGVNLPQNINDSGKHTGSATFTISQSLLRGFGTDVNLASIRNTYANEITRKLTFKNTVSSTIVKIVKQYRSLITSNYTLSARRKELEDAKIEISNSAAKIKAGIMATTDIYQSQAQYERLQLMVTQEENGANIAMEDLLTEIGLDPEMNITVPANIDVETKDVLDLDKALLIALEGNFEYQNKLITTETLARSLKVAKNYALWDLDLKYRGGLGGGQIAKTFEGKNFHHSLSVELKIPIMDFTRKEQLIRANISVKKNELTMSQAKRSLLADVKKKLFDINNLKKQVESSEKALLYAGKSYEAEKKKHELGKTSSLNLSNAQDNLLQSKTGVITAKIGYENSLDDLSILLGTTLDKWNIELEY